MLKETLSGDIPLQENIRTYADGVGFLDDVSSNYQIVCIEGTKSGARNQKIDDDDNKNIKNMAQLFNNIIVSEVTDNDNSILA
ncbi:11427_t:CDS:2 [Funneliformis caledonium]|uniref:11427_t:CDS:1 n=1 Tax=Funneliformis caledonium TaxID=1117310 RepID=A0A9N9C1X0_9GLOM|nr:11427_t:CDS:2 [Funneliformis caledonium]